MVTLARMAPSNRPFNEPNETLTAVVFALVLGAVAFEWWLWAMR